MRIHIVQKGDILFDIAKKYGVSLEAIIRMNPQLSSPDMIMPGMKIKIPTESKQIRQNESNVGGTETGMDKAKKRAVKEERVEEVTEEKVEKEDLEMLEARTTERPMGEVISDDVTELKPIRAEVPRDYKPLYPVKPNMQSPTMPKYMNKKEADSKDNKIVQQQYKAMETRQEQMEVRPQTQYRPMSSPQQLLPSMRPPMYHCCCCCCRQSMYGPRQPMFQPPVRGTYSYDNQNMC